jgi:hypothetical protein
MPNKSKAISAAGSRTCISIEDGAQELCSDGRGWVLTGDASSSAFWSPTIVPLKNMTSLLKLGADAPAARNGLLYFLLFSFLIALGQRRQVEKASAKLATPEGDCGAAETTEGG